MKPLRTVLFNDSPTARALLRAVLEATGRFEVVAEGEDGSEAAELCDRAEAELVLMDVVMPRCDGFEATRAIMARRPVPIVIVSAAVDVRDTAVLFEAMRIGALFVAEPPPGGDSPRDRIKQAAFVQILLNVTAAVRPGGLSPLSPASAPLRAVPERRQAVDVIGLCASAGGPAAVTALLDGLPPDNMPPILLVQHLAPGFTETFAHWLEGQTPLAVRLAEPDRPAEPGHVYLAPDDRHLGWSARGRLVVSDAPAVGQFRPSATFLLDSLCAAGRRAIGIVLSGMGDDGASGAARLRKAGGHLVVQSKASSAVYGMPRAALQAAGADEEMSPQQIREWLARRFGGAT